MTQAFPDKAFSGIGGISDFSQALSYFLLGCGTVQVCTAAMLDQAVGLSDLFLERGEVVSQRGRRRSDIERYYARPGDAARGRQAGAGLGLTVADLFSGAGGLSAGFSAALPFAGRGSPSQERISPPQRKRFSTSAGPHGAEPSKTLPGIHCGVENWRSRAERSLNSM